ENGTTVVWQTPSRQPNHLLIYDKDNTLRFVTQQDGFLIIPDSMGSNCEIDHKTISALIAGTWKVQVVESPDYTEIKEIRIFCEKKQEQGLVIELQSKIVQCL
ncbi:MAG: hypothetical protein ABIJ53_09070, partial [Verrucomicrobiota bacterium]